MELTTIEFGPEYQELVAEFECGADPWAHEQTEWIRNAPPFHGALWAMQTYKTTVWLHLVSVPPQAQPFVFGYSSLGYTNMQDPYPDGERCRIQYIPGLALAEQFHGQRVSQDGKKYSHVIMEHVLSVAAGRKPDLIGLHVYPGNTKAIRLYQRFGFEVIGGPDKHNLLGMWRRP